MGKGILLRYQNGLEPSCRVRLPRSDFQSTINLLRDVGQVLSIPQL